MTSPAAVIAVPIDQVQPGPNVRTQLDGITALAASIRAIGVQQPLLVHQLGPTSYEIFDGHRRRAALLMLGARTAPVIVRTAPDDRTRLERQLGMHTHTRGFDPIDEALAVHQLIFDHGCSHEKVAAALARTPRWVSDRLALLVLNDGEQRSVRAGTLSLGEAKLIVASRRSARSGGGRRPPAPKLATRPQPNRSAAARSAALMDAADAIRCEAETTGGWLNVDRWEAVTNWLADREVAT